MHKPDSFDRLAKSGKAFGDKSGLGGYTGGKRGKPIFKPGNSTLLPMPNVRSIYNLMNSPFFVNVPIRAHMMACGSALKFNLRRLHAHLHPQQPAEAAAGSIIASLSHVGRALFGFWAFLNRTGSVMATNIGHSGLRSAAHSWLSNLG
jgi:hypothetical protein